MYASACPLWSRTTQQASCSSTVEGGGKRRAIDAARVFGILDDIITVPELVDPASIEVRPYQGRFAVFANGKLLKRILRRNRWGTCGCAAICAAMARPSAIRRP